MIKHIRSFNLKFLFLISFLIISQLIQGQKKTLGVTKHLPGSTENGYILFNPIEVDTAFLMNKCGKIVHTWESKYAPGFTLKLMPNGKLLRAGVLSDTSFTGAGGRGGIIEILDWNSNVEWTYKLLNDSISQHHEVFAMPNGNVMVLCWYSKSKQYAIDNGRNPINFNNIQNDLWGEKLIELKPLGKDSAEIVWEWSLWDHIVQDYSALKKNYANVSQHPELIDINYAINLKTDDWIHANSIDFNPDFNQIVISCHNMCEIWVIDHSTSISQAASHSGGKSGKGGDILYRWGNPEAYKMGTLSDRKLFRQHNANWIPEGYRFQGRIVIFNNGWGRDTNYSTIDVIKPPVNDQGFYTYASPYGPAKPIWQYKDSIPTNFYSQIISGAHRLSNASTMVCSGVQGRLFEISPQKKIVWEYRNPYGGNGIQTDGQAPKDNSVFRCTFIPDTFSGLKNKQLIPTRTLEKNSRIYSCAIDINKPLITALLPNTNNVNIPLDAKLKITFSETVLPQNIGLIKIYENKVLKESINVTSSNVNINLNEVTVTPTANFGLNSRISVAITNASFRDSNSNTSMVLDSVEWHFTTIKSYPKAIALMPYHNQIEVNNTSILKVKFDTKVFKNSTGNILLYAAGNLIETIPVGSVSVTIVDSTVTIIPASNFALNTFINVSVGKCFVDANGIENIAIPYADWQFKTMVLPVITNLYPAKNATNVLPASKLVVTFNKPIKIANVGNVNIYTNGIKTETISISDTQKINIVGSSITITPSILFASNATINVSIDDHILKDTIGNLIAAINYADWQFTTQKVNIIYPLNRSSFSVYPNPVADLLTINIRDKAVISSLIIYDAIGRKVDFKIKKQNKDEMVLDIAHLANGIYTLVLNQEVFNTIVKH